MPLRPRRLLISVPMSALTVFLLTPAAHAATAASSPPAGGAPLDQVVGATVAGVLLSLILVVLGLRHRAGHTALLDGLARPFVWLLRVPGWAALPAAIATGALVLAGAGFYWDVAVHIDRGRDPGPFGTAAHFPILIGLFGLFSAGWLAVAMAAGDEAGRTGIRITRRWTAPTSGLVMLACASFAVAGFPLDDVWHAVFGQDVTLWGPTHLILLTGGQLMIPTILGLLAEGRVATRAARDTRRDGERTRSRTRTRAGRLVGAAVSVAGAGGVLAGLTVYQGEFGFGVPQFALLFQPALLAFTGALALTMGRLLVGRGGALAAAAFNIVVAAGFAIVVGPVLGHVTPRFSTYLPAAVCVELAAVLVSTARVRAFAVTAGVLVGVLGTLGEAGWTHVWMPIPWPAHFLGSAVAIGVPAGVCGALVGAFVAGSLSPFRVGRPARRAWLPGAAGLAGLAAVLAFSLPTHAPAGATATIALDRAPTEASPDVDATVTVRPASLVRRANFVQQLSWQGHRKLVRAALRPAGPGVFRTAVPLPLHAPWKTLIRLQTGRTAGDVPVFLPPDPAIPIAGIPARTRVTRAFASDAELMQLERKSDVPGWLWDTATAIVLGIIAVLLVIMGWGLHRVGATVALRREPASDPAPRRRGAPLPVAAR